MHITASLLYDYLQCPHRVWRDAHGPQNEKITEPNPFVELLWNRGVAHEERVIKQLADITDISTGSMDDRFARTLTAMNGGALLIYQGVVRIDKLLGIPDLLRRQPDGSYMPLDIKSGMGSEGGDEDEGELGKPKKHYAAQLALYVDALQRLGYATEHRAAIIDLHGQEVLYELDQPMGSKTPQTFWESYQQTKLVVTALLENKIQNQPAMIGACKVCPWYGSCKKWCQQTDDMTAVFYLGRSTRQRLHEDLQVNTVKALADVAVPEALEQKKADKTFLAGIGEKTLTKMVARAKLLSQQLPPVLYQPVALPVVDYELFFDIEDDPTQEFVYLHGVYERTAAGERFVPFVAKEVSPAAEAEAWSAFWQYIRSLPAGRFAVYYYSHHEKTTYRRLQRQYPDVISVEELEVFFANPNVIDLYTSIILPHTDWPVWSYSLKTLATYAGFSWRDATPSGALSIQWYNDYLQTRDPAILQRIIEYNEDDCKATLVIKDVLVDLMRKYF